MGKAGWAIADVTERRGARRVERWSSLRRYWRERPVDLATVGVGGWLTRVSPLKVEEGVVGVRGVGGGLDDMVHSNWVKVGSWLVDEAESCWRVAERPVLLKLGC